MFRTIAAASRTSNQEQTVEEEEEESPVEDCAMSCRSCGLEVSREGLSSNSFFPARPAVWQVGSKKEGDVR
jgi:hypothetical protein